MKSYRIIYVVVFLLLSIACSNDDKKNVLIIGDSISLGYTPFVQEELKGIANVCHNWGIAGSTSRGVDSIHSWLGNKKWDIIYFNFGLHDLCYRDAKNKKDKLFGKQTVEIEKYASNLDFLVQVLKNTGAKLIFATTTMVPEGEPGRNPEDPMRYNQVAIDIMQKNNVLVDDLYNLSLKIHPKYGKADNDVHYQDEGYKQLANSVVCTIKANI